MSVNMRVDMIALIDRLMPHSLNTKGILQYENVVFTHNSMKPQ